MLAGVARHAVRSGNADSHTVGAAGSEGNAGAR